MGVNFHPETCHMGCEMTSDEVHNDHNSQG